MPKQSAQKTHRQQRATCARNRYHTAKTATFILPPSPSRPSKCPKTRSTAHIDPLAEELYDLRLQYRSLRSLYTEQSIQLEKLTWDLNLTSSELSDAYKHLDITTAAHNQTLAAKDHWYSELRSCRMAKRRLEGALFNTRVELQELRTDLTVAQEENTKNCLELSHLTATIIDRDSRLLSSQNDL